MKTIHLAHIIVYGMVTIDDDIIYPFIFPHDLKLNVEAYINYLEELVQTWIEREIAVTPNVW